MSDTKWQVPAGCRNCVWLAPWNGKGYGCGYPTIRNLLGGVMRCEGRFTSNSRHGYTANSDLEHAPTSSVGGA